MERYISGKDLAEIEKDLAAFIVEFNDISKKYNTSGTFYLTLSEDGFEISHEIVKESPFSC